MFFKDIYLLFITIVVVYLLYKVDKLSKQTEYFATNVSDEALQNLSSLLNTGQMKVSNLEVTGEIKTNTLTSTGGITIDSRGGDWGKSLRFIAGNKENGYVAWHDKDDKRINYDMGTWRYYDSGKFTIGGELAVNGTTTIGNSIVLNGHEDAQDKIVIYPNLKTDGMYYFLNKNGDLAYHWPLDELKGNVAKEEVNGNDASVANPQWIKRYYSPSK